MHSFVPRRLCTLTVTLFCLGLTVATTDNPAAFAQTTGNQSKLAQPNAETKNSDADRWKVQPLNPEKTRLWKTFGVDRFFHFAAIEDMQLIDNGDRLVTSSQDGILRVWNTKTRQLEKAMDHSDLLVDPRVTTLELTSDRRQVFVGIWSSYQKEQTYVVQWNLETGERIKVFDVQIPRDFPWNFTLKLFSDDKRFLVGSFQFNVVNVETEEVEWKLNNIASTDKVAVSSDRKNLVYLDDSKLKVYSLEKREIIIEQPCAGDGWM